MGLLHNAFRVPCVWCVRCRRAAHHPHAGAATTGHKHRATQRHRDDVAIGDATHDVFDPSPSPPHIDGTPRRAGPQEGDAGPIRFNLPGRAPADAAGNGAVVHPGAVGYTVAPAVTSPTNDALARLALEETDTSDAEMDREADPHPDPTQARPQAPAATATHDARLAYRLTEAQKQEAAGGVAAGGPPEGVRRPSVDTSSFDTAFAALKAQHARLQGPPPTEQPPGVVPEWPSSPPPDVTDADDAPHRTTVAQPDTQDPTVPDATPTEATPTEATPTEATPTEATPMEATPTEATLVDVDGGATEKQRRAAELRDREAQRQERQRRFADQERERWAKEKTEQAHKRRERARELEKQRQLRIQETQAQELRRREAERGKTAGERGKIEDSAVLLQSHERGMGLCIHVVGRVWPRCCKK